MAEPRAYSAEEVRDQILGHMRMLAGYWDSVEYKTSREKLDGLCFSILNIFDGTTVLPAFDIHVHPHESDKAYAIENDENWYEPGMLVNQADEMLHDQYFEKDDG